MKALKKPRLPRARLLARLQFLVGRAKNVYLDDRAEERAGPLLHALDEAFEICLKLSERYRP